MPVFFKLADLTYHPLSERFSIDSFRATDLGTVSKRRPRSPPRVRDLPLYCPLLATLVATFDVVHNGSHMLKLELHARNRNSSMHQLNRASDGVLFTGSKVKVLMSGEDTDGQYCMLEFRGPPGRSTPLHMHDREDETLHLLEGKLQVTLGDQVLIIEPGDTLLLPRHVAHKLTTLGTEDARYIVVCAPAGFEEFVGACATTNEADAVASSPTPADIARLREQAPRYGITILPTP